jgi:hypothetical protein
MTNGLVKAIKAIHLMDLENGCFGGDEGRDISTKTDRMIAAGFYLAIHPCYLPGVLAKGLGKRIRKNREATKKYWS